MNSIERNASSATRTRFGALVATVLMAFGASFTPVAAQEIFPDGPHISEYLFAPDVVIRHHEDLGLTDEQKDRIIGIAEEFELDGMAGFGVGLGFMGLHTRLRDALEPEHVDEEVAIEAARAIMDLERDLKLAHLTLLVRVKNVLTARQQAQLHDMGASLASHRDARPGLRHGSSGVAHGSETRHRF